MAKMAEKKSHKRKNKAVEPSTASQRQKLRLAVLEKARKKNGLPPEPPSPKLLCKIAREFCGEMDPAVFEEARCTVCGQLTAMRELTALKNIPYSLDVLECDGVTRMERKLVNEDIQEVDGPVRDLMCDSICVECETYLSKGTVPPLALANRFWIEAVPDVLKGLSFAEKLLIARIRHNRCLVRASSGRAKMTGNVIMFSNPTLKVYKELPPTRSELEDVLAFIFTGPVQPTPDDFARTPMLVNHTDYHDLIISEENLQSYPLAGVPVVVDYKRTEINGSNKLSTELSVHDSENEEGTEMGQCPFTTVKTKALNHLMAEGKTLGIGHSAQPESMYDNPQAYPQLFPWFFPYGMGGFENAKIVGRVSEETHKRKLLLYHDKCFQTDVYFPIVVFNHAQMKSSSTSSFLVAKRANSISERMIEGEIVKPVTEDEKNCFNVLTDIDKIYAE
ncbi:hypothetical protein C8F04DRAFT_1211613 [Mycena alexandri]|uniref:DUF6570 domain-containing protein n=1 Tax=Mycena alexandri TaxID=1745969 RepID=A0AAD6SPT3_9AGAR|nr:hypothetical protein C8F04DRAFT_1211613 [Mycena alexandri]